MVLLMLESGHVNCRSDHMMQAFTTHPHLIPKKALDHFADVSVPEVLMWTAGFDVTV